MTTFRMKVVVAAALACFSLAPRAEDELLIYAQRNGTVPSGLAISVDGGPRQTPGPNGLFQFDLDAGGHTVQLFEDGQQIHAFRIDSAAQQRVDVRVELRENGDPAVSVDSYFLSESGAARAGAATGTVTGRVNVDGAPLAGATVAVVGANVSTQTDTSGRYQLAIPRGTYDLQVSHPSLDAPQTRSVRVVGGMTMPASFSLSGPGQETAAPSSSVQLEEIVVTAAPVQGFGAVERFSQNVVDSIDASELARFGDSDIAASVPRLPSITIEDGRYLFIRGLGGRYITTVLNGATMPSTDPSRRTVPLDLFPSNIVETLDINKTFLAQMPGESTGGNLVINTRTFPAERGGKLSASLGYVTDLTGESVSSDPNEGGWDWLGWDGGEREEDGLLPLIATALDYSDEYSQNTLYELQQVGGLLIREDLDPDTTTATPKVSLGANYGDLFVLDGGSEFGYFIAGNYRNQWEQRADGISRTYASGGDVLDDFEFFEHSNVVELSGLLSLGLNIGENSFKANTLVSRFTESSVRVADGFDGDQLLDSYSYSIEWEERQFVSQQISGEHVVTDSGSVTANWQLTGSQATRLAPDRREVRFDLEGSDGVYNLIVPELNRRFDDLVDDNLDASTDWAWNFDGGLGASTVRWGLSAISRERDSDSATYGYTGGQIAIDDNAPNRRVDDVLTVDNITGNPSTGYAFTDKTLASDSYDADLRLYSGYTSYGLAFASFEAIAGVRYEQYEQTTNTFSLSGAQTAVESVIDEDNWLPSLSLNWYVNDRHQVRAAISQTVTRPDFKETSNATFYDEEFDFRVRGNPNLRPSDVTNFDLRWEQYFNRTESVSVAAFYKDLESPIERVVQPASGTAGNSRTFQNAESGELYGIEVDGRKEFGLDESFTRSLFVQFNASWIESEVELLDGETRKLQGQPDYTANLIFGFDDLESGQEVTLLLNQAGETIVDVGVSGLPNIILEPRLSMNLLYKYAFSDTLTFRAEANNLLDADYEYTQGGEVFQKYNRGVELEAGIDWNF